MAYFNNINPTRQFRYTKFAKKVFFGFDKNQIYHFTMRVGGCEYGMVLRVSRLRLIICLVFAVCLVVGGWWLGAGGVWPGY